MDIEYTQPFELKELTETGSFSGILSVIGVEDLGGDIIEKGAFTKTISENPTIPILWQHDKKEVIGEGTVSEWQGKILIKGKLDIEDDPVAQKAYSKMKRGRTKGLSYGYRAIKSTFGQLEGRTVRRIQELKLFEGSVVTFPMLPSAQVTRVKDIEGRDAEIAALKQQVQALEARIATLEPKTITPEPAPAVEPPQAVSNLLAEIEANL